MLEVSSEYCTLMAGATLGSRPAAARSCLREVCTTSSSSTSPSTGAGLLSTSASTTPPPKTSASPRFQWLPGDWSPCSAICGKGTRTRVVQCIDFVLLHSENLTIAADAVKCTSPKPPEEGVCRAENACPKWHRGQWSECSASCGWGVARRAVYCRRGKDAEAAQGAIVADAECFNASTKPFETKKCKLIDCPLYTWRVMPWSKCTDPCKATPQHRRIYCVNSESSNKAAERMCANLTAPVTTRQCSTTECPYEWVPGPWSACSRTCGIGLHFRRIECRGKKTHFQHVPASREEHGNGGDHYRVSRALQPTEQPHAPLVLARMCLPLEKPVVARECVLNPSCEAKYHWSVGPWSQCSRACGPGHRRRRVKCMNRTNERVDKAMCDSGDQPTRREKCFERNCMPSNCAEVKSQLELIRSRNTPPPGGSSSSNSGSESSEGIDESLVSPAVDGNYTVLVAGHPVRVYCHLMNSTAPRSYLNVEPATNFAEFYGKRLAYPYSCPHGGARNDSCACIDDGHVAHGRTEFAKVRVDMQNMNINPNDHTFATTLHGQPVAYGTAGDCYSMSDCPQGRFSIDLRGSGLRVVTDLQWISKGHRTSAKVERSENNALIIGQCGGYCGDCAPDRFKGLVVEVDAS